MIIKKHLEINKFDIDSTNKNHKEFIKSNKLILKTPQRFKSERYNLFTEEINKITLCSNDDKKSRSINLIEIYAYGMNKHLVCKKEKVRLNNIIKQYKNV